MKDYNIQCKVEDVTNDGLIFDKELIYVGTFGNKKKGYFEVTEKEIDHWVSEAVAMMSQGFKINLPVEHTTDPEANRGEVMSLYKKKNSRGKLSLFGKIKFSDEEAAKLAKRTDVSIYSPRMYEMGNGYIALRPITHVALTSYPLVPGLEGFEAIAASTYEEDMNLTELATALGLAPEEGADDKAIADMIVAAWTDVQKKLKEASAPPKEDPAVQASLLDLVKKSRKAQIANAVSSLKMTPAEAKEWESAYTPDTFAASNVDGFDKAFALIEKRAPLQSLNPKTVAQQLPEDKNPVLIDAKRRASSKRT